MIKFDLKYFALTILLFVIEVFIALFVHDEFIRPYFGDVLVVILIYCFIKSFFNMPVLKTVILVLSFSFLIEYLQYRNFVATIGLENSKLANTILGNSFAWEDILSYLAGAILIVLIEKSVFCKVD